MILSLRTMIAFIWKLSKNLLTVKRAKIDGKTPIYDGL
jgi:hypothetical protein